MPDITLATTLGEGQVSANLPVATASTFFVDSPKVIGQNFWYVDRLIAMLTATFSGVNVFNPGDSLSLCLLPSGAPIPELGLTPGQIILPSRGMIVAEIDLGAANGVPTIEGDTINYGGANQTFLATLRMLRPCRVPTSWNMRAIANLSANTGSIMSANLTLNYQYAVFPWCR